MCPEIEVVQTLAGCPVYGEDGKPWTAPISKDDIWIARYYPFMYRSKIILALLSAGF